MLRQWLELQRCGLGSRRDRRERGIAVGSGTLQQRLEVLHTTLQTHPPTAVENGHLVCDELCDGDIRVVHEHDGLTVGLKRQLDKVDEALEPERESDCGNLLAEES